MNRTAHILIISFLALLSIHSNAQNPFTTYSNSYFKNKYVIYVSAKGNIFTLFINAMPSVGSDETGGLIIHEDNYSKFIDGLKLAKLKYEDAVKKAKEKNATNLNTTLKVFNAVDIYFKQDQMYAQKNVELIYNFKVEEIGGKLNYFLFVNTGKLTALNNTSVHSDGYSLVFSSANEIDQFINKISPEKIDSAIVKNDSTGYVKKLRKIDGSWHSKSKSGILANMTLGIKAGFSNSLGMNNLSPMLTDPYSLSTAKPTIANGFVGVFGRVDFNRFYLQPEFLYVMGQNKYALALKDDNKLRIDYIKTITVSTLDIPLLLGYKIGNSKNTNFRVFAGPKLRLNAGSLENKPSFQFQGKADASGITTDITPTQWGFETGLGVDFSAFTLDVRYNLIKDMYHSQWNSQTIDNLSANTLVISLGWKIFRPKK